MERQCWDGGGGGCSRGEDICWRRAVWPPRRGKTSRCSPIQWNISSQSATLVCGIFFKKFLSTVVKKKRVKFEIFHRILALKSADRGPVICRKFRHLKDVGERWICPSSQRKASGGCFADGRIGACFWAADLCVFRRPDGNGRLRLLLYVSGY